MNEPGLYAKVLWKSILRLMTESGSTSAGLFTTRENEMCQNWQQKISQVHCWKF